MIYDTGKNHFTLPNIYSKNKIFLILDRDTSLDSYSKVTFSFKI